MSEEKVIDQDVKPDPVEKDVKPAGIPYERFKDVNDAKIALEAELEAVKTKQEKARKAELEKQGEYKTLLEEAQAELEKQKAKASEWDLYQENRRKTLIEKLPDEDRELYGGLELDKLELHVSKQTNKHVTVDNSDPIKVGGYTTPMEVVKAVRNGDLTNQQGQGLLGKFRRSFG